jgi:transcriptional regulator with XRE-family HTH domain
MQDFSRKVGARIRIYRKARRLSLGELANHINKSKATLSKYESGAITLDILTLYEIAAVLKIDLVKLVEHLKPDYKPALPSEPYAYRAHQFPTMLYLYHAHHHKYYTSLLYFDGPLGQNSSNVTLYYKITGNPGDLIKCINIYHGTMSCSDSNFNFILKSFHNQKDLLFLSCYLPLHITASYPGLLLGIQSTNMRPASCRILLSPRPLPRSYLERNLQLTGEEYRKLRTGSYYSIKETSE